jgi:5-methyltetrahydrofolate--homocysteine methyltransferase
MASAYPPRPVHDVEPLMRISGLEPLNYQPDAANMRSTFLNIGERCNVAGSIMFKKAIINNDYDTALSIALKQVQQGAHVLDINMDDGLIDGVAAMTKFVNLCIAGGQRACVDYWLSCMLHVLGS